MIDNVVKKIDFETDIFKLNNLHKIEFLGVLEKYKKSQADEKDGSFMFDDYREKHLFFKTKNDICVISEKYDFLQKADIDGPVRKTADLNLSSFILTKNLFYDIFSNSCEKTDFSNNETSIFAFVPEEETFVRFMGKEKDGYDLSPIFINTNNNFVIRASTSLILPFTTVFSTKTKLINNINIYPFINEFLESRKNNTEINR